MKMALTFQRVFDGQDSLAFILGCVAIGLGGGLAVRRVGVPLLGRLAARATIIPLLSGSIRELGEHLGDPFGQAIVEGGGFEECGGAKQAVGCRLPTKSSRHTAISPTWTQATPAMAIAA